jgi:phosphoglycerate dehydrogenase-like enzyme
MTAQIVYRLQPWAFVDRLVFDGVPSGFEVVPLARDAPPPERHALLANAEYLMGSWVTTAVKLTEDDFRAAPRLKLLQLMSVGYEHVDLGLAARYGVPVATFGDAMASVVAEHTLLLILGLMRHIRRLDGMVRSGAWRSGEPTMHELRGKRVGLVGYGAIAREVARRLAAFDCEVVHYSRSSESTGFDDLLRTSDIVSLHVPLAPSTRGLIGSRELSLLKPGALLINTSRGAVVDQAALLKALQSGALAGAGLDVLDPEPPAIDDPLLQLDNVLFTPHVGGTAEEAWPRIVERCFANIQRVERGELPVDLARPLE